MMSQCLYFNIRPTITMRFQENDGTMKCGLVCVGFGMVDVCDVLSFISIYIYIYIYINCNYY